MLLCPFCRTKLYLVANGHFRYCIPAPETTSREILYLPYWRLKGMSFAVAGRDITNRFFDTNRLAMDVQGVPYSLGLRPQVFRLRFASPEVKGRFLAPGIGARAAMQLLSANAQAGLPQVFIGEMISLIYSPVYLENGVLYDSLLQRSMGSLKAEDQERLLASCRPPDWQVRFISTLCPQCGWDLQGESEALVLICRNCNSAWTCPATSMERVPFAVTAAKGDPPLCYLPFWRMKARIEGLDLKSCADLIRVGNLPKAITGAMEERPFYFWSPAFKINPALFLRWTRQMTTFQPAGEAVDNLPAAVLHPVTLPASEAEESIVITLASLIADKRRWLPLLPRLRITLEEALLTYHPFTSGSNELIHTELLLTINKNALAFGRQL